MSEVCLVVLQLHLLLGEDEDSRGNSVSLLGDAVQDLEDQGEDGGVNAANLRRLIRQSEGVDTTTDARDASVIQTRHRVPEDELVEDQILVLQVPVLMT